MKLFVTVFLLMIAISSGVEMTCLYNFVLLFTSNIHVLFSLDFMTKLIINIMLCLMDTKDTFEI